MTRRIRRGACVVALFTTAIATVNFAGVAPASAAINISFTLTTNGSSGLANIDAGYGNCGGTSPDGGVSGYDGSFFWDSSGSLRTNTPIWTLPPTQVPNPGINCGGATLSIVRLELYPNGHSYDPWSGDYGGAHAQREKGKDGAGFANFGTVPIPTVGVAGGFRIEGDIVSSTPVPDGRVKVDLFQIGCIPPDVCAQPPVTETGAEVGAFTSGANKGKRWTGSVGWPGHYLAFVEDTATGRKVHGFMELYEGQVQTLDLDASCFGMLTCYYDLGGPGAAQGGFHPLSPTRILDTRTATGITNGQMTPGDGRSTNGDGYKRQATMRNHELKVTGVGGIPAAGVSAVLLNVTAVATSPGFLTVYPRPPMPADTIFWDQGTFGPLPSTSNLNFVEGEVTPNLVLVKVGAGGTIRFSYSGSAPMHVIADVAGWFDTGEPTTAANGLGFTGITPVRLMDTRNGIGDTIGRFQPGDNRSLQVTGIFGVPTDAKSVVVNITSAAATDSGFVTAFPDGTLTPNASNLNISPAATRANLAVVKVGTNGKIRLAVFETDMHLIVDIFGYYSASGGLTTIIEPTRVFDTRDGTNTPRGQFGPGESRDVQIAGIGGVPTNATAVIANVTVAAPSEWGYLTAWPAGQPRPDASNVNFINGRNVPNLVILGIGAGGRISIYNALGSASVIVDVFGYVV
ncbi:MAG: hypothetical protein K8R99_12280 [Actinomycetia bacterium]|nr:hypothetical protein [Actinomycetes bacterium]